LDEEPKLSKLLNVYFYKFKDNDEAKRPTCNAWRTWWRAGPQSRTLSCRTSTWTWFCPCSGSNLSSHWV